MKTRRFSLKWFGWLILGATSTATAENLSGAFNAKGDLAQEHLLTNTLRGKIEGIHYKIRLLYRDSPTTVLAIHAGKTEIGTGELARSIADEKNHNLYIFESLIDGLHITSTRFDEPRAIELVSKSESCLSIHGFKEKIRKSICIGGQNEKLRSQIKQALSEKGLEIEIVSTCPEHLRGKHPKNIVNRCKKAGVQIELSNPLRKRILDDPIFRKKIAQTLADELSR
ncbi:MAG: poly-gamma-glutamate hydrolase family protein [Bdellovibrionota bacterium]